MNQGKGNKSSRKMITKPLQAIAVLGGIIGIAFLAGMFLSRYKETPQVSITDKQKKSATTQSGTFVTDGSVNLNARLIESSGARTVISRELVSGWVAIVSVDKSEHRDYLTIDGNEPPAGATGYSQPVTILTLTIDKWLRVEDSHNHLRKIVVAELSPESRISGGEGQRGVAIFNPYAISKDNRIIPLTQEMARSTSVRLGTQVASGGALRYWLPAIDGDLYQHGDQELSLATIETILFSEAAVSPVEMLHIPTSTEYVVGPRETAAAATLESFVAERETESVGVRATSSAEQAKLPPFLRPNRHNGPMSKETALLDSIDRFVPGTSPTVAFAYRMKARSVYSAIGHEAAGIADQPVWFIGLLAPDISAADYRAFFDIHIGNSPRKPVIEPPSGEPVVLGEYYIWDASNSAIVQMGAITQNTGQYTDLEQLLKLSDDAPGP